MVPGLRQAGSGGFARRRGGVGVIGGTLALFALIIAIPLAMPGAPSSAQLTTNDGGNWIVDPELSQIIVSGTHAGKPFAAQFTDWRADIRFDPEAPEAARVEVVVDAAAVETGNSYYDNTLKESGWLAPSTFPVITFVSQDIAGASTGYAADGELTIRDTTLPAQLVFTLDIEGDTARMEGRAEISRLAYGVGNAADPKAEWVSDELIIDVAVTATRGEADQP